MGRKNIEAAQQPNEMKNNEPAQPEKIIINTLQKPRIEQEAQNQDDSLEQLSDCSAEVPSENEQEQDKSNNDRNSESEFSVINYMPDKYCEAYWEAKCM